MARLMVIKKDKAMIFCNMMGPYLYCQTGLIYQCLERINALLATTLLSDSLSCSLIMTYYPESRQWIEIFEYHDTC